jgi:hypothetical protein
MSDTSTLSELARFIGRSDLNSENTTARREAVNALTRSFTPRPNRHRVGDLLGIVMALSARARRTVQPRVDIDLDVFSPAGGRAVRLICRELV